MSPPSRPDLRRTAQRNRTAHDADGQQDPSLSDPAAQRIVGGAAGARVPAPHDQKDFRTAMTRLRIGTRGSPLAMWQANEVAVRPQRAGPDVGIKKIPPTGAGRAPVPPPPPAGQGAFLKNAGETPPPRASRSPPA